jgi:hypothetical protein
MIKECEDKNQSSSIISDTLHFAKERNRWIISFFLSVLLSKSTNCFALEALIHIKAQKIRLGSGEGAR